MTVSRPLNRRNYAPRKRLEIGELSAPKQEKSEQRTRQRIS